MAACGSDGCVQVVKSFKTVQVPCTKNTFKQYTVKVPRQVSEQVPRTIQYTDFESRSKQVPYTVNRQERRIRMETQKYQVPVTTQNVTMVPVTKKVPKTIYVDVTTNVPQQYTTTTMETRERQVPVPYFVNVPETKYRTVTEQVPVQRSKIQMDTVMKTIYDNQVRTRCVPETKIVTKQIPVYNVIARPAPPIPANVEYGGPLDGGVMKEFSGIEEEDSRLHQNHVTLDVAGVRKDEQPSSQEYLNIQATGDISNTAGLAYSRSNNNRNALSREPGC